MNLNIFCSVALGVSLFLIVFAVVLVAKLHRAELKNTGLEGRRRILTPFQVFLLCFFFAAVAVFFPIYYVDYFVGESGGLRICKAFLLAVQNVLRLVTLNGEFDNIRDFLADTSRINAALGEAYSVYITVIFVAAPLLTAGFVLSFFRNASAMLRYSLRPCRELYVMSELNVGSLALAKNILGERKRGQLVIFADVFEGGGEQTSELIFSARQMGAICVKKDVTDLGLKYARKCRRKIYLLGSDEDENLRQALILINRHRGTKYDGEGLEFYVFSQTAESCALLDSTDHGAMRVRRVNGDRDLVLREMRRHPIFSGAVQRGEEKAICLAIVGTDNFSTEMLKAVCCIGQMPMYTVEVHVFDRGDAEERLHALAPEFLTGGRDGTRGDAQYRVFFHELDAERPSFCEEVASIKDLTGVYISLGEDEKNIGAALRLRTALRRRNRQERIPVYAVVRDPAKADIVAGGGLKNMNGMDYAITFIGSLNECYSSETIEKREMEEQAIALHLQWAKTEAEKSAASEKFGQYEYYRRSSGMQALYRMLREELGLRRAEDETADAAAWNDLLRRYEHRRWNTYMRGEGYIRGEITDHVAKTHALLIPFDDLPEDEKKKDDF